MNMMKCPKSNSKCPDGCEHKAAHERVEYRCGGGKCTSFADAFAQEVDSCEVCPDVDTCDTYVKRQKSGLGPLHPRKSGLDCPKYVCAIVFCGRCVTVEGGAK